MRQLRKLRGWTVEDLASRAGISARTLYDVEGHHRQPHRATRLALALALGCDPAAICSASTDPVNSNAPADTEALHNSSGTAARHAAAA